MFLSLHTKQNCRMDHCECSDALFEVTKFIDDILLLNIWRCIFSALVPSRGCIDLILSYITLYGSLSFMDPYNGMKFEPNLYGKSSLITVREIMVNGHLLIFFICNDDTIDNLPICYIKRCLLSSILKINH